MTLSKNQKELLLTSLVIFCISILAILVFSQTAALAYGLGILPILTVGKTTGTSLFIMIILFFILVSGLTILLVYIRNFLQAFCLKEKTISDQHYGSLILKKSNGYVLLAILLCLIFLKIGTAFMNEEFKPVPNTFNFNRINYDPQLNFSIDEFVDEISEINCKRKYEKYVVGDKLTCDFSVIYKNGSEDNLPVSQLYALVRLTRVDIFGESNYYENEDFVFTRKGFYNFKLYIPDKKVIEYDISLHFSNYTGGRTTVTYAANLTLPEILTYPEYESWKDKKLAWFVGLLLMITSVFLGVREFRDLVENNK